VKGNLSAAQIVEQVFRLNEMLAASGGADAGRITNIVFMGMGEPLSNYANVMKAVEILHDPKCFKPRRPPDHDLHRRRAREDAPARRRRSADQPRDLAARPQRAAAQSS
jgi:hypothetical protein